jgi:hypothetical protein
MSFEWKRPAVFGLSFGVGAGLSICIVLGIYGWYKSKPEPWHENWVKASDTTADVIFYGFTAEKAGGKVELEIDTTLENTTARDFTLDIRKMNIYSKSQATGVFTPSDIQVARSPLTLHAGEKTKYSASLDTYCYQNPDKPAASFEQDCLDKSFEGGFVIYDGTSKLRISIPKPIYKNPYADTAK